MSKPVAQTMLDVALKYLELGMNPIPVHIAVDGVCSCHRGASCHTPGKHPAINDWQNSTLDQEGIIEIWMQNPSLNVGIVTGKLSNIVALDIDAGNGGYESLRELEEKNGALPITVTANTGGGGKHYIFQYPDGLAIPTRGGILRGIDIRGDGGQIVACPSWHSKNKTRYKWVPGLDPINMKPVPMPQWLIDLCDQKETVWLGETQTAGPVVEEYHGGNRNNNLFALGRRMRVVKDMTDSMIAQLLHTANKEKCKPPLPDAEVDLLISSVLRKPGSQQIVAEGGTKPGAIKYLTMDDLRDDTEKPIPYLVPNLISEGEICLLASPTEAGKSMIAMSLTLSIVAGLPAWGRGDPCKKGRVMYCTEEVNPRTIKKRFGKLARGLDIDLKTLTDDMLCIIPQQNFSLAPNKRDNIDALILKAQEFKPDLVILDTFVSYFGASEQEADVARAWFSAVPIAIRNLTGSAVLIQHHTRKLSKMQDGNFIRYTDLTDDQLNNEIRGTSDLGGVNERIFFIWKKSEEMNDFGPTVCINVRNTKAREGDKHPHFFLVIKDTDEKTTTITSAMAAKSKKHQEMEHHLREVLKTGEVVTRAELMHRLEARKVSRPAAYRWIDTFKDIGILVHDKATDTYFLNGSMEVVSF